jgi:hypothetical protein
MWINESGDLPHLWEFDMSGAELVFGPIHRTRNADLGWEYGPYGHKANGWAYNTDQLDHMAIRLTELNWFLVRVFLLDLEAK